MLTNLKEIDYDFDISKVNIFKIDNNNYQILDREKKFLWQILKPLLSDTNESIPLGLNSTIFAETTAKSIKNIIKWKNHSF